MIIMNTLNFNKSPKLLIQNLKLLENVGKSFSGTEFFFSCQTYFRVFILEETKSITSSHWLAPQIALSASHSVYLTHSIGAPFDNFTERVIWMQECLFLKLKTEKHFECNEWSELNEPFHSIFTYALQNLTVIQVGWFLQFFYYNSTTYAVDTSLNSAYNGGSLCSVYLCKQDGKL